MTTPAPGYLSPAQRHLWQTSPRVANRAWFGEAAFGLFIHYGLYTQLGRGEWVMFNERIPVAEYERLAETFDPKAFDADFITDLALDTGMRYINLTACHHEGFCLWDSATEPFNSKRTCGRDLVGELASQCARKGLGFFAYFTHLLNWRHPAALPRERVDMARPDYPHGDPRYKNAPPEAFWAWSHACLRELCQMPDPLAGIWLDIITTAYREPELVPVAETYRLIRELRPEALLSYKQGFDGSEDFAAPEFRFASLADRLRDNPEAAARAERAWSLNKNKHNEICMTLQSDGKWGWSREASHRTAEELWGALAYARTNGCNLLANVGPLPDGSIHPADIATLRETGRRLRMHGLPGVTEGREIVHEAPKAE